MTTRTEKGWTAVGWLILLGLIADITGWLGPRDCPACQQPRSWHERIHGFHDCDWTRREATQHGDGS